jgi:hypothetical protein
MADEILMGIAPLSSVGLWMKDLATNPYPQGFHGLEQHWPCEGIFIDRSLYKPINMEHYAY